MNIHEYLDTLQTDERIVNAYCDAGETYVIIKFNFTYADDDDETMEITIHKSIPFVDITLYMHRISLDEMAFLLSTLTQIKEELG